MNWVCLSRYELCIIMIIIKVFTKCKISPRETFLSERARARTHRHTHRHTHTHTHTHTRTHARTRTNTHTRTHAHARTHAHPRTHPLHPHTQAGRQAGRQTGRYTGQIDIRLKKTSGQTHTQTDRREWGEAKDRQTDKEAATKTHGF